MGQSSPAKLRLSLPLAFVAQSGFEDRHFPEQSFHCLVECRDRIRAALLGAEDIGGQTQSQRRDEPGTFRLPLEVDLQVDSVFGEVFQMILQLVNFLLELVLQLPVGTDALGHEIPFECHSTSWVDCCRKSLV